MDTGITIMSHALTPSQDGIGSPLNHVLSDHPAECYMNPRCAFRTAGEHKQLAGPQEWERRSSPWRSQLSEQYRGFG